MSLTKLFRILLAAMLLAIVALIAVLTVIIVHGLCRSPFGAAGVTALLAHLDSSNLLNPVEAANSISRFFLTYIGALYLALLLWWVRSRLLGKK